MVERQTTIKSSPQEVWQMFADMNQWIDWDPDFAALESVD